MAAYIVLYVYRVPIRTHNVAIMKTLIAFTGGGKCPMGERESISSHLPEILTSISWKEEEEELLEMAI